MTLNLSKYGLCCALSLTAGSVSSAHAADYISAPATPWTRAYLGVNVGGGAMNTDIDILGIATFDGIGSEGWLAGGRAGFDVQVDRFVLGFLGGAQWEEILTETNVDGIGHAEAGTQWGVDALGRVGFLLTDSSLLYGLGGLSGAEFAGEVSVAALPLDFSKDWFWLGWTVGAGLESSFTDSLSALLEYRYTEFEGADAFGLAHFEPHLHTARLGLNWKFYGH
jgi:outer membrane immunogenic protein